MILVGRSASVNGRMPKSPMLRVCESGGEGGEEQGDGNASHVHVGI